MEVSFDLKSMKIGGLARKMSGKSTWYISWPPLIGTEGSAPARYTGPAHSNVALLLGGHPPSAGHLIGNGQLLSDRITLVVVHLWSFNQSGGRNSGRWPGSMLETMAVFVFGSVIFLHLLSNRWRYRLGQFFFRKEEGFCCGVVCSGIFFTISNALTIAFQKGLL